MLLIMLLLLTLLFVAIIAYDIRSVRSVPRLAPVSYETSLPATVAVIVPARDEAQRIGTCLAGLATQRVPDLPVLVLDDGSTDGTGAVVRTFRDHLPGLQVLTGVALPVGWAGKCWACWQAAQMSNAEWLLFLDADTAPQPGMIAALLKYAVSQRLDFLSLTLMPVLDLGSVAERMLLPAFGGVVQAVYPIHRANDPRSTLAFANGQCLLVRRAAYFAVDGHRAVRTSVLEDMRLAQEIKRAEFRTAVVDGPDLLRVRMYTNRAEVVEGLGKNAVAGARAGGTWRSAWGGVRQSLLVCVPPVLMLVGLVLARREQAAGRRMFAFGAGLWLLTMGFWAYLLRRFHRLRPWWALLYPFGTLWYFAISARAMWRVLRGTGVNWKGRTYRG